MKPSEEFRRWWNEAIKSGSFQGRGEWMAWQARQPEIDALRRDNATFVGIHHEFDLAKARIKELEGVNLALIAERDMLRERNVLQKICAERSDEIEDLRAELDLLKNQEPVAGINEMGDGLLYAKPISPAIPAGMALVPIDPTYDMQDFGREALRDCGVDRATWNATRQCYRAMITAAQKGGA